MVPYWSELEKAFCQNLGSDHILMLNLQAGMKTTCHRPVENKALSKPQSNKTYQGRVLEMFNMSEKGLASQFIGLFSGAAPSPF